MRWMTALHGAHVLFFVIIAGYICAAQGAQSYRVPVGGTVTINEFGSCQKVTNNCSRDFLVPTKISAQWAAFRDKKPVCASIAACFIATGGTISYAGGYTIHTFATVGASTFQVTSGNAVVEYLVVGGGGGGAYYGGGGGGGGVLSGSLNLSVGDYGITVGQGGTGGTTSWPTTGGSGGSSSFATFATALGGGGGGWSNQAPGSGGSGGGGGFNSATAYPGGIGTAGQGYSGGAGATNTSGGGGGGAGGASTTNNGGLGLSISISGAAVLYGSGGGGANVVNAVTGANGTDGRGEGGTGGFDGSFSSSDRGGRGGSGVVILRYATP